MTRIAALSSIVFCASLLTYGLVMQGYIKAGITVALFGMVWLVMSLRRVTRFIWLAFILFGSISAGVIWAGVPLAFAMGGMVCALLAWDLSAFDEHLVATLNREDVRRMEAAHFARLALVLGPGLAGVVLSRLIRVELTLGSALVFALLGIWGLSALVYRLRSDM